MKIFFHTHHWGDAFEKWNSKTPLGRPILKGKEVI